MLAFRGQPQTAGFPGPALLLRSALRPTAPLPGKQRASWTQQQWKQPLILTQPDRLNVAPLNSGTLLPKASRGYLFLLYKKTKTARQAMPSIRTTGVSVRNT